MGSVTFRCMCISTLGQFSEELQGIMGVHVDDVLTGGRGPVYDTALAELKATFPFLKWQEYQGMFCGSRLEQDPETSQITVSQQTFVDKMQRPKLRNKADENLQVTPEEASSLKSVLGGALWLVGSTFSGGSQVLMDGLGHVEWLGCHLAEVRFKHFSVEQREKFLQEFKTQAIVDCKSICDHVHSLASPGSVSDKGVAIDLVIKETLQRVGAMVRWCPT